MANNLIESRSLVVSEYEPQNQIHETGLAIVYSLSENPSHEIIESGLMILHDAQAPTPNSKIFETGLMILHRNPTSLPNQKLQSFQLKNFSLRQASSLKKNI